MSKNRNWTKASMIVLSWFAACAVNAQEVEVIEGEVQNAEIVIEKERKIVLNKRRKHYEFIKWKPEGAAVEIAPITFASFGYNVAYEPSDFKPQQVTMLKTSEVFQHYAKMGFGTLVSPLLDISLNSKADPNKSLGFNLKHESFARGPVDHRNSANGDTQLNVLGSLMGDKAKLTSAVNYQFSRDHFYGYGAQEGVLKNDIRHDANFLNAKIGVERLAEASDWTYALDAKYNLYTDNAESKENTLHYGGALSFAQKIFVNASGTFSKNEGVTIVQSRSLFRINPYYRLLIGELALDVGMSMSFQDDEYQGLGTNKFAPYLKADFKLTDQMSVYTVIDGGYEFNQLYELAIVNRYLDSAQLLFNSQNNFQLEVGTNGRIGENFSFTAGIGFDVIDNLMYITNAVDDPSQFVLNYDSLTSKVFSIKVNGRYQIADGQSLMLDAAFQQYSSEGYQDIYHVPIFTFTLKGQHALIDRLNLSWSLELLQGIKGYDAVSDQSTALSASTILDLGLHYQLKDRLGIFLTGSNLLNQPNTVWMNYQQRGVSARVGATFRF